MVLCLVNKVEEPLEDGYLLFLVESGKIFPLNFFPEEFTEMFVR